MPDHQQRDHALEVVSAVMMALATVGSAWSAYQSTRWSGLQAIHFSQAAAARAEAGRKTSIATQKIGVDVGLFLEYATALSQKRQDFADFLLKHFPPRLAAATKAWLAMKPLENAAVPRSPFDMKGYRLVELEEAGALLDRAEREAESAKTANQTGDNYVLLTVFFSSVLFFSGVGLKFTPFALRVTMLAFGGIVFLAATIALATFPIH